MASSADPARQSELPPQDVTAGCATFCSYRDHNDHRMNNWTHLQVGFAADTGWVLLVAELASRAGCGLPNAVDDRYPVAYAPSPSEMLALAKAIHEKRDGFDALPHQPGRESWRRPGTSGVGTDRRCNRCLRFQPGSE